MSAQKKTGIIVFALAILLLFVFFPAVMLHPNSSMFSIEGDGIKNYFSFLYYLRNDAGLHFTGMNYPFGEHLSFADGQPALAVPFRYLALLFPQLKQNGIALINLSALLGFAIAVLYMYKILLVYRVQHVFAAVGAMLIVFLSPQLFRLQSHYGLSYAFFFPLVWYCSIKLNEGKKIVKWSTLTMLAIVFLGLLHFYLAALNALFLLSFAFLKTILQFKKTNWQQLLANWLVPVSALVLLQLFMFVTDAVTDRPPHPWGFFYAIADWTTVFLPHPTDLFGNASRALPGFAEGFSYIGLIPVLVLFFVLIRFTWNLFRLRWSFLKQQSTNNQSVYLLAAIPVLLFSMCIPFIWGLEKLVDYLSFLRQFRVLGRFAWVFYYVAGVETVAYLYRYFRLYRQHQLKRTAFVLVTISLLIWSAEIYTRIHEVNKRFGNTGLNHHVFTDERFLRQLSETGHYASDFQAILSFPFFHQGSEQFSIEHGPSQFNAMQAAFQLNIPVVNVMMSRTSLQQSCNVLQLLSDSLIEKPITQRFTKKPLLLITSGTSFSDQENVLIQKAQLLKDAGDTKLYLLPVEAFAVKTAEVKQRYATVQTDTAIVLQKFFSNEQQPLTTFQSTTGDQTTLFDGTLPGIYSTDTLELSVWVKIDLQQESLPVLQFQRSKQDGTVLQQEDYFFKLQTNVYRQCVLLKQQIVVAANDRFTLRLSGKGSFSNLLIRKKGADVFQPIKGFGFYFNNIPVKL